MSNKAPPFKGYAPVASDDVWKKVLAGEINAHIYSSEAQGDLEPVPISPAEIFSADEASRDEDGEPDPMLRPYQIMWRDRDRRRLSAIRRAIPVPHWVYIVEPEPAATKSPRSAPGAPEIYDWDDVRQFTRREFEKRGDFLKSENRVKGWRSQNDLIKLIKDYLDRLNQPVPGDSQLKKQVAETLKQLRSELPTGH
jgi:hypothetical protein